MSKSGDKKDRRDFSHLMAQLRMNETGIRNLGFNIFFSEDRSPSTYSRGMSL